MKNKTGASKNPIRQGISNDPNNIILLPYFQPNPIVPKPKLNPASRSPYMTWKPPPSPLTTIYGKGRYGSIKPSNCEKNLKYLAAVERAHQNVKLRNRIKEAKSEYSRSQHLKDFEQHINFHRIRQNQPVVNHAEPRRPLRPGRLDPKEGFLCVENYHSSNKKKAHTKTNICRYGESELRKEAAKVALKPVGRKQIPKKEVVSQLCRPPVPERACFYPEPILYEPSPDEYSSDSSSESYKLIRRKKPKRGHHFDRKSLNSRAISTSSCSDADDEDCDCDPPGPRTYYGTQDSYNDGSNVQLLGLD